MLLKCTDNHGWKKLKTGEVYDVAEIFDMPEHVMVRRKGSKRWPKPGDELFGFHPAEYFEKPAGELEIARSSYELCKVETMGTLITDTGDIERFYTLDNAVFPTEENDEDMEFEKWRKLMKPNGFPVSVLKGWYDLVLGDLLFHWWYHRNIHPPEDGLRSFLEFGIPFHHVIEKTVSLKRGTELVQNQLKRLGIRAGEIRVHSFEIWEKRRWKIDLWR